MLDRLKGVAAEDPLTQAGRLAEGLARKLVALGIGFEELVKLLNEVSQAQDEALSLRQAVEGHEARLDDAAVHAAETMVGLSNAVAGLTANREQLVEGGLADDAMLKDLDFQIGFLTDRIAEVKADQSSENRVIEKDLSPERDRLVSGELERQTATTRLIRRVIELKPESCPPDLQRDFHALEDLTQSL